MKQIRRILLWAGGAACVIGTGSLLLLNACHAPLRVDPVRRGPGAPVVDADLELARTYAPWVYHEFDPRGARQDLPSAVDFDGDLDGEDNWENFPHYELVPTLYYAVLETESHWFLTYHIFHPRDWEPIELGLHTTHEGDGENLQVVVEKATRRVVLLFTQAHYCGGVYANEGSGFADAEVSVRGPFLLVDDEGRPVDDAGMHVAEEARATKSGTHAAVFVEARGHGIFATLGDDSRVVVASDGSATWERAGWILRPARADELVLEPPLDARTAIPYQLESTTAKLWPLLASGALVGEGRLLDGCVAYRDERVTIDLPRYHEADRFSGPFGPDRGISPFAVDFDWSEGTLGALFFDPAGRYAGSLAVPRAWSQHYVQYPLVR